MIHDEKASELIERYCSGVDRNVVLSRSVDDKRCVCLNRDKCSVRTLCKYDLDDKNASRRKNDPLA